MKNEIKFTTQSQETMDKFRELHSHLWTAFDNIEHLKHKGLQSWRVFCNKVNDDEFSADINHTFIFRRFKRLARFKEVNNCKPMRLALNTLHRWTRDHHSHESLFPEFLENKLGYEIEYEKIEREEATEELKEIRKDVEKFFSENINMASFDAIFLDTLEKGLYHHKMHERNHKKYLEETKHLEHHEKPECPEYCYYPLPKTRKDVLNLAKDYLMVGMKFNEVYRGLLSQYPIGEDVKFVFHLFWGDVLDDAVEIVEKELNDDYLKNVFESFYWSITNMDSIWETNRDIDKSIGEINQLVGFLKGIQYKGEK